MLESGFDPRATVVLVRPAPLLASEHGASASPGIRLAEARPGYVWLHASTHREAYLVLSESYYPGWVAEEGGRRVEMVPADHAIMAVRLAPGVHDVTPRFTTPWLIPSLIASAVGLCGISALAVWGRCRGQV